MGWLVGSALMEMGHCGRRITSLANPISLVGATFLDERRGLGGPLVPAQMTTMPSQGARASRWRGVDKGLLVCSTARSGDNEDAANDGLDEMRDRT
jgi:hypothetical protein